MELTKTQKMEAISKDFLDRDQDTYVKIRRTGRLGWESLIPAGGNYSDLLRDCRGTGDVIKEAYGMARDYIVAMDTPYRVTLRLSPEMNCTDSRVVYLATRVFDDPDLSEGQKVDTFIGLAVHEGCHLKWTDFTQMPSEPSAIIRNLINVLEDERIERECGETMPGYANYLKATKYYMFDLYRRKSLEENSGKRLSAPVRLLNAILSIIRYPKALDGDDLEEFADELYAVREVVLDYPKTSQEVTAAAKAIYEIIKHYFEKQIDPKNEQGDSGEAEDGKSESGKSGNGESEDGKPGDGEAGNGNPESGETGSDEGSHGSGQDDESRNEGNHEKSLPSLSEEEKEALEKAVSEALSELEKQAESLSAITSDPAEGEKPLGEEEMASCVKRDDCQLAGICENTVSLGETSGSVLYRAPENREGYEDSLRRVRKYIPAIAKTLKGHCQDYAVTYHGMRSGLLDTGKLAEAYQGVQTVYVREGMVRSDRMAVCVLIDESGSMYGEKIRAARDLAVLLNEAIGSIPAIDLYVYGRALGSVEARSGNLDSYAIREAAARMRKLSSCRKNLMFVITDGAPNERYEQLTATVKELEKTGMSIVAVCIEPSYDPSALYTHHVRFTDMSRLAIDLGKMIKKAILKNASRVQE